MNKKNQNTIDENNKVENKTTENKVDLNLGNLTISTRNGNFIGITFDCIPEVEFPDSAVSVRGTIRKRLLSIIGVTGKSGFIAPALVSGKVYNRYAIVDRNFSNEEISALEKSAIVIIADGKVLRDNSRNTKYSAKQARTTA